MMIIIQKKKKLENDRKDPNFGIIFSDYLKQITTDLRGKMLYGTPIINDNGDTDHSYEKDIRDMIEDIKCGMLHF